MTREKLCHWCCKKLKCVIPPDYYLANYNGFSTFSLLVILQSDAALELCLPFENRAFARKQCLNRRHTWRTGGWAANRRQRSINASMTERVNPRVYIIYFLLFRFSLHLKRTEVFAFYSTLHEFRERRCTGRTILWRVFYASKNRY